MSFVTELRAVVRRRDFRRLYGSRLSSQLSDGLFQVALASYVFFSPERQTSAAKVAAAFAVLLVPYSLVGPFAGVLLDRMRRRQVLIYCSLIRALVVVVVAGLIAAGWDEEVFYLSALAVLSVNRFFLAALSAALPHVVPRHELVMANSVSTTSGTVAAFAGGLIAFAVEEVAGQGRAVTVSVVLGAAAFYLGSAAIARLMDRDLLGPDFDPARPQAREALRRVLVGMADGARHVWHRRRAGYALAAIAAHRFFYGVSTIATILLYRNYFNEPVEVDAGLAGLGVAVFASGLGYFAAALITPGAARRTSTSGWIVVCFVGAAGAQVVFGLPYTEPMLVAGAFVLGIVAQATKICVDTIVQQSIDDAYRGRVFSFYDVLFNVSFVSAAVFAALALPATGKSYPVLATVAAGYAVSAIGYGLGSRNGGRPADWARGWRQSRRSSSRRAGTTVAG